MLLALQGYNGVEINNNEGQVLLRYLEILLELGMSYRNLYLDPNSQSVSAFLSSLITNFTPCTMHSFQHKSDTTHCE